MKTFFTILFKLMTFKGVNSEYSRWFDISSSILIWLNILIIIYILIKNI
jgi:hypothetical protein